MPTFNPDKLKMMFCSFSGFLCLLFVVKLVLFYIEISVFFWQNLPALSQALFARHPGLNDGRVSAFCGKAQYAAPTAPDTYCISSKPRPSGGTL